MIDELKPALAGDKTEDPSLAAGDFSVWLHDTRQAQKVKSIADVPCGDCNGCCRSAYFIHIAPQEIATLERIPKQLLFAAPGLPKGHVLMGYDAQGHCPMLKDNRCSIYEDRPQTCRAYDCRVFPAAGIAAGEQDKELVNRHIRRWRFNYPNVVDQSEHLAVQTAVKFLREHADSFPPGFVPSNAAQLAMLAIKVYEVFIGDAAAESQRTRSESETATLVVEKLKQFDSGVA